MVGFAAASYQRGVNFIQIPTSVMAMVDSSVGGKTGVNHALGKNMIGAFHQPQCVFIDTNTLNTLPDRELKSGISEIIKYGLIRDAPFFEWQEKVSMGERRTFYYQSTNAPPPPHTHTHAHRTFPPSLLGTLRSSPRP